MAWVHWILLTFDGAQLDVNIIPNSSLERGWRLDATEARQLATLLNRAADELDKLDAEVLRKQDAQERSAHAAAPTQEEG